MDNKFLHKVVDQIISETRIDYDRRVIKTPHRPPFYSSSIYFSDHCKDVYGLNEQEIDYVWKVYRGIIKDKIKEEKYR